MMLTDSAKVAVSGGVILATSAAVLRTVARAARPNRSELADQGMDAVVVLPERTEAAPAREASSKLRILTGEPAPPESRRPAPFRALRLVGGITALAAAGAVGLLALVSALVKLFQRLG
jgi:hypothetical protein